MSHMPLPLLSRATLATGLKLRAGSQRPLSRPLRISRLYVVYPTHRLPSSNLDCLRIPTYATSASVNPTAKEKTPTLSSTGYPQSSKSHTPSPCQRSRPSSRHGARLPKLKSCNRSLRRRTLQPLPSRHPSSTTMHLTPTTASRPLLTSSTQSCPPLRTSVALTDTALLASGVHPQCRSCARVPPILRARKHWAKMLPHPPSRPPLQMLA